MTAPLDGLFRRGQTAFPLHVYVEHFIVIVKATPATETRLKKKHKQYNNTLMGIVNAACLPALQQTTPGLQSDC